MQCLCNDIARHIQWMGPQPYRRAQRSCQEEQEPRHQYGP